MGVVYDSSRRSFFSFFFDFQSEGERGGKGRPVGRARSTLSISGLFMTLRVRPVSFGECVCGGSGDGGGPFDSYRYITLSELVSPVYVSLDLSAEIHPARKGKIRVPNCYVRVMLDRQVYIHIKHTYAKH